MDIFADQPRAVKLPIRYAGELSNVARIFGAPTIREARKRPGGFGRPFVGRDPFYYERKAGQVFNRAVKDDKELAGLYLNARSLTSRLEKSTTSPYSIGGPAVGSAAELVGVSSNIQAVLQEKDLRITLEGKWLERAKDISAFALRVIVGSGSYYDGDGRLYRGLPAELPVNTADYWNGILVELSPVAAQVVEG